MLVHSGEKFSIYNVHEIRIKYIHLVQNFKMQCNAAQCRTSGAVRDALGSDPFGTSSHPFGTPFVQRGGPFIVQRGKLYLYVGHPCVCVIAVVWFFSTRHFIFLHCAFFSPVGGNDPFMWGCPRVCVM